MTKQLNISKDFTLNIWHEVNFFMVDFLES